MSADFVTRFAPSPTGYLHRGHAYSALVGAEAARRAGGRFLMRIEDIDSARCRPEYEAAIAEDLDWLGVIWERPVRRQSDHLAEYQSALSRLEARGLIYKCRRTRREILEGIGRAPQAGDLPDQQTPHAKHSGDDGFAWRLSLDAAERVLGGFDGLTFEEEGAGPEGQRGRIRADPRPAGDVVLARKGLGVSYHLAAVVDDAAQGVTHVIRGRDLFPVTPTHRLLQALLDLPTPFYRHHPLVLRPDGKRFAKRDSAETLRDLRAGGVTANALREDLGL